ncbi:hypothetical protein EWE75_21445 [Sphingomonas populi]|uniref:O-antigen ligase domain-containing protein n=1 Tax=Sphingomonas populi TaxID=2484750 RepID=A0A4Q6XVL6_9SPHN|nr:hypothetical protein [Sphingomonas populi]RZF60737.1 hypothetical protein EWE75_21445 [Sphingomonas populi]
MEDFAPRLGDKPNMPYATGARPRIKPGFKSIIVAIIFLLDEGIFSVLLGSKDFSQGRMLSSAAVLLAVPAFMISINRKPSILKLEFWLPIILFVWMIFSSAVSNVFIFDYPTRNWLLATYSVMPLLCVIIWRALNLNFSDVVFGIILAALAAGILVIIDKMFPIPQFITFRRMSAFGQFGNTARLTILKDACVLGFLISFAKLSFGNLSPRKFMGWTLALIVIGFPIAFSFESRIAFSTLILSVVLFFVVSKVGATRRALVGVLGAIVGTPIAIAVLGQYISAIASASSLSDYFANNNVSIRFESNDYFVAQFMKTYGFGVGIMSSNPEQYNILSSVVYKNYILDDLGLFAALYQFGIIGCAISCLMTVTVIIQFVRLGRLRLHPSSPEITMAGCFVLASVMQPIPANFFTLTHACLLGGTLWYAAFRARWEVSLFSSKRSFA